MTSSFMLQLHLGAVETVILSLFSFLLGTVMHKHINILHRWAIPVPAIGGLTVAVIVFLLQISGLILITLDKAVLVPAMVAFFATMGLVAPDPPLRVHLPFPFYPSNPHLLSTNESIRFRQTLCYFIRLSIS